MPEVKLLKRMAGPDGNHSPGFVMKVDADIGQQLVDQGAAEWVAPIRQQPIERAVVDPVERAAVELKKPNVHEPSDPLLTELIEKPNKEKLKAKGRKKQG
jgi:hypothetical protein